MSLLLLFAGGPAPRPKLALMVMVRLGWSRRAETTQHLTLAVRPVRLTVRFLPREPIIVRRDEEPAWYE